MIGELWIQTRITITFRYNILCILTLVTQKLKVVCRRSTYQMTALLSEIYIFCVRAECEIWIASYASKHASQSISEKQLCIYKYSVLRCITWRLQIICGCSAYPTTAILSDTFFVWFRVAIEIRLESYSTKHTSVVLWYNIVCVYYSLFGTQLHVCLTTKLTYLMTAYCTWNDTFTANDGSFYNNNVG